MCKAKNKTKKDEIVEQKDVPDIKKKSKKEKKPKIKEEVPEYIKLEKDEDGNFLDTPKYLETSEDKTKDYPEFLKT